MSAVRALPRRRAGRLASKGATTSASSDFDARLIGPARDDLAHAVWGDALDELERAPRLRLERGAAPAALRERAHAGFTEAPSVQGDRAGRLRRSPHVSPGSRD